MVTKIFCRQHFRFAFVLLGVLMCFLASSHMAYASGYVQWDEYDDSIPTQSINEGETKSVTVSPEGEVHSFCFTPNETGYYLFYTDSDDINGPIRDGAPGGRVRTIDSSNGNVDCLYIPEWSYGVNSKWFFVRFKAVKGKEYYLDTKLTWTQPENVSYEVTVQRDKYESVVYKPNNRVELLYNESGEEVHYSNDKVVFEYSIGDALYRSRGQFEFTKSDGTKDIYKYLYDLDTYTEGFVFNGTEIDDAFEDWRYYSDQDGSNQWGLGQHEFIIYIDGKKVTIPVWVVSEYSYDPDYVEEDEDSNEIIEGNTSKKTNAAKSTPVKKYTVKYNLNGGKGTFKNQTKTKDKVLTLRSGKPTKTGYNFQGWATSKNGKVVYKAGSKYKKNANVALYAKWTAKTYTVKYNLNGGKGTFKNQKKTHGKALTLRKGKPAKKGYSFQGWSTKKNGKVAYKAGAKYKANKAITLYAKWKKSSSKTNSSTQQKKTNKSKGNIYVLVYGAAKGKNPSSSNNVSMMNRALKKLKVPGYTISSKNVVQRNTKSFSKDDFVKVVKSTFKNAGKNDLCFIYLNTHSKGIKYTKQKVRDYNTGELKDAIRHVGLNTGKGVSNYYSWNAVLSDIEKNVKGKIIFMPEVCNSGKFIDYVKNTELKDRMIILAAAKADSGAEQNWFFGSGNYTLALTAGLGFYGYNPIENRLAADKDKNGKVTINEIHSFIKNDKKVKKSGQSPQLYVPKSMKSFVIYQK